MGWRGCCMGAGGGEGAERTLTTARPTDCPTDCGPWGPPAYFSSTTPR